MSKGFTIFLDAAEVGGSLGIIFGVLTQLAAAGLILIMLGAIQKKIFVWRTGLWGESGTNGWSYDTMPVGIALVVLIPFLRKLITDKAETPPIEAAIVVPVA